MRIDYSKTINEQLPTFDYYKNRYISYELELMNNRKEIERLNNIIDELEKALDENVELTYVHNGKRQYNKTLTEGGLLFRDYIKSKLQELKGSE